MEDVDIKVQKYIVQVCKFLPEFVNKWTEYLDGAKKPLRGLVNLSEQLRHVEKVRKSGEENFLEMQQNVLFSIYEGIEEEMKTVKNAIDQLLKLNNDLKNKLSTLEQASLSLDLDDDSSILIKGTALQPSLRRLLDLSLDFLVYFVTAGKDMQGSFKDLDVRNERAMKKLEESFQVDLNDKAVNDLIAITQYVENEKKLG